MNEVKQIRTAKQGTRPLTKISTDEGDWIVLRQASKGTYVVDTTLLNNTIGVPEGDEKLVAMHQDDHLIIRKAKVHIEVQISFK